MTPVMWIFNEPVNYNNFIIIIILIIKWGEFIDGYNNININW